MIEKVWDPNNVMDQIQMRAVQKRRPLNGMMELTYRCNFHCRMCYIRMTDEQAAPYGRVRTVEEWLGMAQQMRNAGVYNLTLTGGECTVYPGFEQLYEQLAQMGFRMSIMTNAGAYTDSIREVFRKYPPYNANITLYGGSNETYEAVTGNPKGLDRVLENIRFFQSIQVPLSLNFTMIRQNVLDYPKVSRICGELGCLFTLITDITRHRYNEAFSEARQCRLSPAERVCVPFHMPEEVGIAMENAKELEKKLEDFRVSQATKSRETDTCIGASCGCAISWNGDMNTCISMINYNDAHPFETSFEDAWLQLKAQQDSTFFRPAACQMCGMSEDCLHNCAGRRFEGTGSPHELDPYTCQYTYLLRLYKDKQKVADIPPSPTCV